jgi:hypothetical protein
MTVRHGRLNCGREPVLDFLRGLDEVKEQALAAALRNVLAYEGIGGLRAPPGPMEGRPARRKEGLMNMRLIA